MRREAHLHELRGFSPDARGAPAPGAFSSPEPPVGWPPPSVAAGGAPPQGHVGALGPVRLQEVPSLPLHLGWGATAGQPCHYYAPLGTSVRSAGRRAASEAASPGPEPESIGDLSRLLCGGLDGSAPSPGQSPWPGGRAQWWEQPQEPGFASSQRLAFLLVGWCYCVVSWVVGAFVLPTLDIHIMPGTRFTQVITRSLAMTLVDLYNKRAWFSVVMLGFFSVTVPIVKLTCTAWLIRCMYLAPVSQVYQRHRRMIWVLTYLASYQLIDLYVGILFVAFFNSDSADARFLEGFYWFFRYCVVSMVCSEVMAGSFPELWGGSGNDAASRRRRGSPPVPARTASAHGDDGPDEYEDAGAASRDDPRQRTSGSAASAARSLLDDAPRRFADAWSVRCFSACFALLLGVCAGSPLLEVRTLWEGVAVDRSSHSLRDIFSDSLPSLTRAYVTMILVLMNVLLPFVYMAALLVLAESSKGRPGGCFRRLPWKSEGDTGDGGLAELAKAAGLVVHALRPWVTTDVFTFAAIIFLFTVQDARTLTSTPEGSYDFYVFIGAGFSFFFLRWFTEVEEDEARGAVAVNFRFLLLIAVWMLVCGSLLGGVPGSSPHFEFPDLDSVCENAMPLLNSTLRSTLPAAYGDCTNVDTRPPEPCQGDKPLMNQTGDGGYIQAVWLGGIDTLSLDSCHLWRDKQAWSSEGHVEDIQYHLRIHGVFDRVLLFLHVRQCGPFGCTRMNSADNCCGDNIRFQLTFVMNCRPKHGLDAFQDIGIEDAEVDPMIVKEELLAGALEIDALDIAPQVEEIVKGKIAEFMSATRLLWAGRQMNIPQLLNHLIGYNSPSAAGSC